MTNKVNVKSFSVGLSILFFALINCFPCLAESVSYEVRERNRIKNLGIIKETKYICDSSTGKPSGIYYVHNVTEYNKAGNKISDTRYFDNNNMEGFWKFQYDRQDNLLEEIRCEPAQGLIIIKNVYKYDFKGRRNEKMTYNANGLFTITEYKYNSDGVLCEDISKKPEGGFYDKRVYKIERNGKMTSQQWYKNEKDVFLKTDYTYDRQDRLIKEIYDIPEQKQCDQYTYQYDGDFIISHTRYNITGNPVEFCWYEYDTANGKVNELNAIIPEEKELNSINTGE